MSNVALGLLNNPYFVLFVGVFIYIIIKNFSKISIGKNGISFEKSTKKSIEDLQESILELKTQNELLKKELDYLKIQLKTGVIVDKRELLLLKKKELYNECLESQMRIVREQTELTRIEQLKSFIEDFNLRDSSEEAIYYNSVISAIDSNVISCFYDLLKKNHIADKPMENDSFSRSKWQQYKDTQKALIWESCLHVMKENFSKFATAIERQEIREKGTKERFYKIYLERSDIIFEEVLSLSFEKEKLLKQFKEKYYISIDMDESEFIK